MELNRCPRAGRRGPWTWVARLRATMLSGIMLAALVTPLTAPLVAAPAQAAGGGGFDTGGGSTTTGKQTVHRKVRSCRLYASDLNFGMVCRRLTGTGRTIKQILKGDDLPECWHEELPGDLRDEYDPLAAEKESYGEHGRYMLRSCLKGIDPDTLEVVGQVEFTQQVDWIPDGEAPLTLTQPQQNLIAIERRDRRIPLPIVATSPSVRPRVGQHVSFSVVNDRLIGPETVDPGDGAVSMRARMIRLEINPQPGVAGDRTVRCAGGGVEAGADDTPDTEPAGCWWTYTRSSAAQADGAYPVEATAYWAVEYSDGGPWQQLAVFDKQLIAMQPVTEIQTVVVA